MIREQSAAILRGRPTVNKHEQRRTTTGACVGVLTNALSKKWENHDLRYALCVAWYNFCRVHMTPKTTPAVAAGLASETWTVERSLQASAQAVVM